MASLDPVTQSTSSTPFDHPPSGTTSSGRQRTIGLDVARAVALIGVVVMNYHGMMNFRGPNPPPDHFIDRVFDISTGALTTRFAATFVLVAGISVTFLTSPAGARSTGDQRVRLVRRGLVLLTVGYFLNEAWPGTILFYYGAYFVVAAFIHRLRTRSLVGLSLAVTAAAVSIASWRRARLEQGVSTAWLNPADIDSLRDFALRVFVGYTHPIFPWLAFFCLGMIIGRSWSRFTAAPWRIAGIALATVVGAYVLATLSRVTGWRDHAVIHVLASMQPNDRGLLYVVSTAGIAVLAVTILNDVAERFRSAPPVRHLQRAGQMTLSLYLLHVLFYYLVVEWTGLMTARGLGAALLVAVGYWILAIAFGSWWHHRLGRGPAERLYRWMGG